ncbi:MAG: hypothetical protein JRI85_04905 [Deltaproteobacteria bacterium]|nr:hypothetical protein [Deltaproteobacteria bacterium]
MTVGIFLSFLAAVIIWLGLTSFLVCLAYSQQKGFWAAGLAGVILIIGGAWFLWWSVRRTARGLSMSTDEGFY